MINEAIQVFAVLVTVILGTKGMLLKRREGTNNGKHLHHAKREFERTSSG